MEDEDWHTPGAPGIAVFLNGAAIMVPDERGRRVRDDSFLVLMNGSGEAIPWRLPPERYGAWWRPSMDTVSGYVEDEEGESRGAAAGPEVGGTAGEEGGPIAAGGAVELEPRSLRVLRRVADPGS